MSRNDNLNFVYYIGFFLNKSVKNICKIDILSLFFYKSFN